MTAIRQAKRKNKRELYGEDARALFLAGKALEEIAELFAGGPPDPEEAGTRRGSGRKSDARCRFRPDGWERP